MRIALFLEGLPHTGGGFQQAFSTIKVLMHKNGTRQDFVIFTQYKQTHQRLLKEGIEATRYKYRVARLLDRWSATVVGNAVFRRLRRLGFKRLGRHLDALLDDHGIDLVLLTAIGEAALRISDRPFIVTIWDLNHRDHPDFRVAFANRGFERVEWALQCTLTRALAVITDSQFCARRIARLYHVDPGRIIELPYLPSLAVRRHAAGNGSVTLDDVRRKYDLPACYVLYPAFYYSHKNHLYLLEGLLALEQRHGLALHVVFCGGHDAERVERQVKALKLMARVRFLGLVPDEDIPALYEGAVALVMPTHFGPTNLPPLEAVTLRCPVIYSDLPEFREQMGDAALYCDLSQVSSLADHLAHLIQNHRLRELLLQAGSRLAAQLAKIDYGERLRAVLDEYAYLRRRWAWPDEETQFDLPDHMTISKQQR
jgi:glycosyltransferase involved in cell wall biosynthesis